MTCPMMSEKGTVVINGVDMSCSGGDCKSRNIIYYFQCTVCKLGYVGKTDQPLHKRVNGHRNCKVIEDEDITDFQILYHHSSLHDLPFLDCYRIWVIKQVAPSELSATELEFIRKFKSLHPFGLSIDNPMGIKIGFIN